MRDPKNIYDGSDGYPSAYAYDPNTPMYSPGCCCHNFPGPGQSFPIYLMDYGPDPFVVNISEATKQNTTFRTALWTGCHLQLTLMSINVGEDIGLEIHPDLDQFIRIEQGQGLVQMGANRNNLDFQRYVCDDFAFIIPAGTWHNLINTGNIPLKLYSIYAPPQHLHGTVHQTKPAEDPHH